MQKDLLNIVTLDFQLFLYFLSFFLIEVEGLRPKLLK